MNLLAWIITISVFTIIYLAITFSSSYYYHSYLRSASIWSKIVSFIGLILLTIAIILLISPLILLIQKISILTYIIFFITLFLINYSYRREFKCSKEEASTIDNMEFIICYEGPINAWYNSYKGKVYIGDKLLKILNGQELMFIYLHEEGHKKHRMIAEVTTSVSGLWLLFLSTLITVLIILGFDLGSITAYEFLLIFIFLTPLASSSSLIVMLWYWLNEHEADTYSSERVGVKPAISALIKIYVYRRLEREGIQWNNAKLHIELNSQQDLELIRSYSYRDIFVLLLNKSIQEAFKLTTPIEIFRKPLPETHPPLGLRIYKLLVVKTLDKSK